MQQQTLLISTAKIEQGDNLRADKINGKKVYTVKGMVLGEVSSIEIDENNWAVKEVNVVLAKEWEKLFEVQTGFMARAVVPIPINLVGPIESDKITLKEEIKEPKHILEQKASKRSLKP